MLLMQQHKRTLKHVEDEPDTKKVQPVQSDLYEVHE